MAESILVSVILTSYNYGRYVGQAVESVLSQTHRNLELIAIDDGSTDNSAAVLSTYADARMQCEFRSNSGQGASWNRGFELSRGELVVFLDSDDWWAPNKVETIVRAHQLLNGDYGVIQHNLNVHRDGETRPYRRILPSGDCYAEMIATGRISFFVTTSGLAFSRRVLEQIFPIPESLRISPDAFLTRTAFLFGPVFSIPQALGTLRLHGSNAGMTKGQDFHEKLRHELIFPELNRFYARQGKEYRFACAPPLGLGNLVNRIGRKLAGIVGR